MLQNNNVYVILWIMFVDSHAHIDSKTYNSDRDIVIKRAIDGNIKLIVNVGIDLYSSEKSIELSNKYNEIYATVGFHPHFAKDFSSKIKERFYELAKNKKVVAIGEIGLDYYRNLSSRDKQKEVFRELIRFAIELNLPIVIHDRDATSDIMGILQEEHSDKVGGVMHCFSGDLESAYKFVEMGFYISFAGPITYSNNKKSPPIIKALPIEKMLIETDCPYLTPEPNRGKRNEPLYVKDTAQMIAKIKNISIDEVARITTENAKKAFRIQ